MRFLLYVLTLLASCAGSYCAMVLWANWHNRWLREYRLNTLITAVGLLAAIGTLIYTGFQVAW